MVQHQQRGELYLWGQTFYLTVFYSNRGSEVRRLRTMLALARLGMAGHLNIWREKLETS